MSQPLFSNTPTRRTATATIIPQRPLTPSAELTALMQGCHVISTDNPRLYLGSDNNSPLYAARENILFAYAVCSRICTTPNWLRVAFEDKKAFIFKRTENGCVKIETTFTKAGGLPEDMTLRELLLAVYDYYCRKDSLFASAFHCPGRMDEPSIEERFDFVACHNLRAIDPGFVAPEQKRAPSAETKVAFEDYAFEPITDVTCRLVRAPRDQPFPVLPEASILGTVTELANGLFKNASPDINFLKRLWQKGEAPETAHCPVLLRHVSLPETVEVIGDEAFMDCPSLDRVDIPFALTTIGKKAFWGCNRLRRLELGPHVKTIGAGALQFPGEVVVCAKNLYLISREGVLYTADGTTVLRVRPDLETVTLPETVTTIADCAFANCVRLRYLDLPFCLRSIGDHAFYNCRRLLLDRRPSAGTYIAPNAFEDCIKMRLARQTF